MKKALLTSTLIFTVLFSFGCTQKTDLEQEDKPEDKPLTQTEMKLAPDSGDTIAILKTNLGEIRMLLYTEQAPETAKNFIELSKEGKYNGTIFHRIIDNFMIQGGDFENRNGTGGYSYKGQGTTIKDEFGEGLEHKYGTVSMANAGPNTGGSQFFIVQAMEGTPWLNGVHAIFGYVYEGMDVVEKMADVEKDGMDKPLEDVVLEEVTVETF
ncbi:MAG: peptidylprolyl isomerase [Nitrospirae bacterium]|nr:peptidylprolyl isomerase [Nitrospirota bacterium]